MSRGDTLQQRTTYLISVTLVKVEAVEENGTRQSRPSPHVPGSEIGQKRPGALVDEGEPPQTQDAEEEAEQGAGKCIKLKEGERVPSTVLQVTSATKNGRSEGKPVIRDDQPFHLADTGATSASYTESDTSESISHCPTSLEKAQRRAVPGPELRETRKSRSSKSLNCEDKAVRVSFPTSASEDMGSFLGPHRASWDESGSRAFGENTRAEAGARCGSAPVYGNGEKAQGNLPRPHKLKMGSVSLPAPNTQGSKTLRKGKKSHTLDNSDLRCLSEELFQGQAAAPHSTFSGGPNRGSVRDRKMLKFFSGIFSKSNPSTAPSKQSSVQRESSEEEGKCLIAATVCVCVWEVYLSNATKGILHIPAWGGGS